MTRPGPWRLLSNVLFAVFLVALVASGFSVPQWAWYVLIASGVFFAVELVLVLRARRARGS